MIQLGAHYLSRNPLSPPPGGGGWSYHPTPWEQVLARHHEGPPADLDAACLEAQACGAPVVRTGFVVEVH